jgi:hypothetical protein
MIMNRDTFFNRIKTSIFGGSLGSTPKTNIGIILDYWASKHAKKIDAQLAYVLATVLRETGRNMKPVRETFATSDAQARTRLKKKAYAKSTPPHGHAYYGRGYVQLTWKANYQKQENKLGVPLVKHPDKALETGVAIVVLVEGMLAGDYNGKGHGLGYYVNDTKTDFVQARRTVNGLDHADEIAANANKFLDAIEFARAAGGSGSEESLEGVSLMLPSEEHMSARRKLKL